MPVQRRGGFTFIEVMATIMVLALMATAAIKLVMMAQNTLSEVKEKESLINAAQAVEAGILTKELFASGTSGDIKWETENKATEMFGADFGRLDFDEGDSGEALKLKWREITVADKKNKKITLYIPAEEEADKSAAEELSADKKGKKGGDGK